MELNSAIILYRVDEPEENQRIRHLHERGARQGLLRQRPFTFIQVYRGEQDGTKNPCAIKIL